MDAAVSLSAPLFGNGPPASLLSFFARGATQAMLSAAAHPLSGAWLRAPFVAHASFNAWIVLSDLARSGELSMFE